LRNANLSNATARGALDAFDQWKEVAEVLRRLEALYRFREVTNGEAFATA
jgi:hypothetical protein